MSSAIRGAEIRVFSGGHLTFVMEEMDTLLSSLHQAWKQGIVADRRIPQGALTRHRDTSHMSGLWYGTLPRMMRPT
jgi:hypothetical protein